MATTPSTEKISEAIEEQLQEHKIVTFKWLSRTVKLHSTTAKKFLAEWVEKKPVDKYVVTYIVFGRKENGELLLMLTKEIDQDYFISKNISVVDRYVYSVQLLDSNFDPALIYNIDKSTYELQQMSLSSISYHTDVIRNNPKSGSCAVSSPIQINGRATCKGSPQKKINDQKSNDINDVPQKENIGRRLSPRKNKADKSTTYNDPISGESNEMKPKSVAKKYKPLKSTVGSGSITNFFSKGPAKKEFEDEPVEIREEKIEKVQICVNAEEQKSAKIESQKVNQEVIKKNDIQTKKDRKSNKKESAKRPQKKGKQMKRVFMLESDSEDGSNNSDGNVDDIPDIEPETIVVQQSETEARIKVIDGKKRKRKVVEDIGQDEEGFMHTTKRVVYESCDSADEDEEATLDKNILAQSNVAELAPPEKKVKVEIPTKKKQSSILSFFLKPKT